MTKKNQTILDVKNGQAVSLNEIPVSPYPGFYRQVLEFMENEEAHCANYYALPYQNKLKFICCLANDSEHNIRLLSHEMEWKEVPGQLKSLTKHLPALHPFEREIHENFGVEFEGHPWLKPLRFPHDRFNRDMEIIDYPFYKIESEGLHEVSVGPIHAGIIEPGHFHFICNGENVLHLEIQLGWQHRGVEKLFLDKPKLLQRTLLAENITGDTTIGHSLAFVQLLEGLGEITVNRRLQAERSIALELERIAIHVGDVGALCTDVAYQLGANVFGALRTPIINFMQSWCGSRFGKGLIRAGGSHYPLTEELAQRLKEVLNDFEGRFAEMADKVYALPSIENRFDNIGRITTKQAKLIGTVGMAAKMAGLKRDIRQSHPFAAFQHIPYEPVMLPGGDVYARFFLRRLEVEKSIAYIRETLANKISFIQSFSTPIQEENLKLAPSAFLLSLTEAWRGEICHCALTNNKGNIIHYKIKDPSMHNWKAVELSLRDLEISDFPINNKSYNLSYCGHDL